MTAAQEYGSGVGYQNEIQELEVVLDYYKEIEFWRKTPVAKRPREPCEFYEWVEKKLKDAIWQGGIKTVVNFGSGYAYIDSRLAKAFPDTIFYAVDRSPLTKMFNTRVFSGQPNLLPVSWDIFNALQFTSGRSPRLLLTMRCLTLFPQDFVERLYSAAYEAGFECVVSIEPNGRSEVTEEAYQFDAGRDHPSVPLYMGMNAHNYPGLMKQAGFVPECLGEIDTGLWNKWHRRVCWMGVRP